METQPNLNDQLMNAGLNSMETDTIGEILNISMGAAATAVSILLNRQVSITTPSVQIVPSSQFEYSELEPALGIEIKYVEGLFGSNHMIMSVKDIRAIVQLLLGEDYGDLSDAGTPLDEIHISALGEVMNQMMGASCTALASFLDREINISPPAPFEISGAGGKHWTEDLDMIVAVGFKLNIEDLVDSEFFTVMPVPFARELVNSAMGISGQETLPDVSDISQVTGHTQVPAPVIGEDYQAAQATPRPAPEPAPKPTQAPAAKSVPAEAKPQPAVAPKPAPAEAKAAPSAARHIPQSMPEPVPTQMFEQEPAENYYPEPAEMYDQEPVETPAPAQMPRPAPAPAARPAPAAVQRPAASIPRTVPAAAANPAPMAPTRSVPAGGYAQDRGAQRQNVVVKPLQFGNMDMLDAFSDEIDAVNLGLVMGVDLNVTVEIGRTRKQVKEILSLRQGSIVELDKQAGAPVDIMVNGKLIARGDVVVIDDNFGVRITEIVSGAAQK